MHCLSGAPVFARDGWYVRWAEWAGMAPAHEFVDRCRAHRVNAVMTSRSLGGEMPTHILYFVGMLVLKACDN